MSYFNVIFCHISFVYFIAAKMAFFNRDFISCLLCYIRCHFSQKRNRNHFKCNCTLFNIQLWYLMSQSITTSADAQFINSPHTSTMLPLHLKYASTPLPERNPLYHKCSLTSWIISRDENIWNGGTLRVLWDQLQYTYSRDDWDYNRHFLLFFMYWFCVCNHTLC